MKKILGLSGIGVFMIFTTSFQEKVLAGTPRAQAPRVLSVSGEITGVDGTDNPPPYDPFNPLPSRKIDVDTDYGPVKLTINRDTARINHLTNFYQNPPIGAECWFTLQLVYLQGGNDSRTGEQRTMYEIVDVVCTW
jgi:hypothetical protein